MTKQTLLSDLGSIHGCARPIFRASMIAPWRSNQSKNGPVSHRPVSASTNTRIDQLTYRPVFVPISFRTDKCSNQSVPHQSIFVSTSFRTEQFPCRPVFIHILQERPWTLKLNASDKIRTGNLIFSIWYSTFIFPVKKTLFYAITIIVFSFICGDSWLNIGRSGKDNVTRIVMNI